MLDHDDPISRRFPLLRLLREEIAPARLQDQSDQNRRRRYSPNSPKNSPPIHPLPTVSLLAGITDSPSPARAPRRPARAPVPEP